MGASAKFYTPSQVGAMLSISKSKVYTLLKEYFEHPETAPFRVVRVGQQYRVPISSFEGWAQEG